METNGTVNTRTMNDRDLGELEISLARQLREVHEELRMSAENRLQQLRSAEVSE